MEERRETTHDGELGLLVLILHLGCPSLSLKVFCVCSWVGRTAGYRKRFE